MPILDGEYSIPLINSSSFILSECLSVALCDTSYLLNTVCCCPGLGLHVFQGFQLHIIGRSLESVQSSLLTFVIHDNLYRVIIRLSLTDMHHIE